MAWVKLYLFITTKCHTQEFDYNNIGTVAQTRFVLDPESVIKSVSYVQEHMLFLNNHFPLLLTLSMQGKIFNR